MNNKNSKRMFKINNLLTRGLVDSYKIKKLRDNYIYKNYEIASLNTSVFS